MTAINSMAMIWNFADQLRQAELGGGGTAYYVYDAGGQRVRKVWEKAPNLIEERLYLGGFEVYRKYDGTGTGVIVERETLHVMDDQQGIALVETRTQGNDGSPPQVIRYQFGNHLGSVCLELDERAEVISYEEYSPYGSPSYQAGRSAVDVSLKRYRYTGLERDEETGLEYHSARYFVPWLGRWTSCDPLGLTESANLYIYVLNRPTTRVDLTGYESDDDPKKIIRPKQQNHKRTKSKSMSTVLLARP
jgi:RHS repeat-associated protein